MRGSQQPEFFKDRHDVADRGRADIQPRAARQRTRAYRLTVGIVAISVRSNWRARASVVVQYRA